MDYLKIYDQLIAHRTAHPPALDEYVELHHIISRCLRGSDAANNLIRLRPADHFFAHLLLAKGCVDLGVSKIETGHLWAAVWVMLGAKVESQRHPSLLRRKHYAWLAQHRPSGDLHPRYDHNIYRFNHLDGQVFEGTQAEFMLKTGALASGVSALLNGTRSRSVLGWYLDGTDPATIGANARRGANNKRWDARTYHFKHSDHPPFEGTRHAFSAHAGLNAGLVAQIINGGAQTMKGWHLAEVDPANSRSRGKNHHQADLTEYRFRHDDDTRRTCTQHALYTEYHLDKSGVWAIVRGVGKGHRGWHLDEPVRPRSRTRSCIGKPKQGSGSSGRS